MSNPIESLTLPKWGLSMTEGTLLEWFVREGDTIAVGDEIAEVETDKMTGPVEALAAGVLRRQVANPGDVLPVGAVLGVLADPGVSDDEIQTFVDQAASPVAPRTPEETGPVSVAVETQLGRINLLKVGDGPETVVLLHGFGGDALNWRFNVEDLARAHTVIAVDLPGHGASTKNVGDGALDGLVSTVIEVLDAENVRAVHVVGHSLGGLVAAKVAAAIPDRVRSLSLIAPAGLAADINREFLDGFVTANSRREVKGVLRGLFADEAAVTRPLTEEVLRYKRLEGVPEALGTLRDRLFPEGRQATRIDSDLEGLTAPVLIISGQEDQILSCSDGPGPGRARVEVLTSVGHSPQVEASAEVNRLLLEFIGAA